MSPTAVQSARTLTLAREILSTLLQYRRVAGAPCADSFCEACFGPHLAKVMAAVKNQMPVTLVLPAFPGKSPNAAKVLGPLPDLAERRALEFLQTLCARIQTIYAPGARVILCSDGRVFSDVVGMEEDHVSEYQREISRLIAELNLTNLSTFNLDDLFAESSFEEMRAHLMARFGSSREDLQAKVRRGDKDPADLEAQDALRMYRGITRFLVEDASHPGQTKSRTAVQKECRVRAYEVILRSNAWSALVEEQFPAAVRLSIHPQTCGAKKLGLRLLEGESWMTPWHGVALETGGRTLLVRRSQAEALGARLVENNGRPSHFVLAEPAQLTGLSAEAQ